MDTPEGPTLASGSDPVDQAWALVMEAVDQRLCQAQVIASRAVVLLPYAQMMAQARRAWVARHPDGLSPRFETSRNWASSLAPFLPGSSDMTGDMARDSLVAAAWLERVAGRSVDRSLQPVLVSRLVEMTRQLAPLAAAQPPAQRATWADDMQTLLAPSSQAMRWEGLLLSLALTWSGHCSYATDVLWSTQAAPGEAADMLLVVGGYQQDPMAEALLGLWRGRAHRLDGPWLSPSVGSAAGSARWHACGDDHDEAERAAACIINHLRQRHQPVALVATDRLLTRRITALLSVAGVQLRDETGWRLSTTHASARLMSLLRAANPKASTDDVLDLLKQSANGKTGHVDQLETVVRRRGVSTWSRAQQHPDVKPCIPDDLTALLTGLQEPRRMAAWLMDIRRALDELGWGCWFDGDAAGQQMLQALHLGSTSANALVALVEELPASGGQSLWTLSAFTAWVRQVLEASQFTPPSVNEPDVVVLPLPQLLGRPFGAVVAPGCDEVRLPAAADPAGPWSASQRQQLGLPSREAIAEAGLMAWNDLLTRRHLDILWRTQELGEQVLPAPWVRQWKKQNREAVPGVQAPDPRDWRPIPVYCAGPPQAGSADLMPAAISASAYQDLRDCPYRFMALRQWRLRESDELDDTPDKRDMGLWLHAVLGRFHEERRDGVAPSESDLQRLDRLATDEARKRGLWALDGEGASGFLPFLAAWPALRDGYLQWLVSFEKTPRRPVFAQAEASLSRTVGAYRMVGQLDRIDHLTDPAGARMVIDYKTEPRDVTRQRAAQPLEDTQLAFYAALVDQSGAPVYGGYLSITDSISANGSDGSTRLIEQTQLAQARDALLIGLKHDLDRVMAGEIMAALGEGRVCDYCAARGLCRKDFWETRA